MDTNLHLTVINPDDSLNCDRLPFDWERHKVRWIDVAGGKGAAWRAVKLRWWDDASYIAYQSRDIDDREDDVVACGPAEVDSDAPF